jgi:thiol-disulfide isomerase/thioredoxin
MKILNIIFALAFGASLFLSCDKIEGPYKEEIEKPVTAKKVLLEDFTGQRCVNCPAAHDLAHDLQDAYGVDTLIIVAIHAGFFATPVNAPFNYDFRTIAGNAYETTFEVQSYPSGMVDRVKTGDSYLIDKDAWSTSVAAQFEEAPSVGIEITAQAANNKISGTINLSFVQAMAAQTFLQIWITEDSIVKPQVIPGGYNPEYVHMHVLRGAVNGDWGQALDASYQIDDTKEIAFSNFEIGTDWNMKNLSIVAIVYDDATKKVLQVDKKKIVE